MIKVLLERRVRKENLPKLMEQLVDLRAAALHQPGYVTGETLFKGDDPMDVMIISTWVSEDHWKAWTTAEARIEINDVIARLIEGVAKISIYKVGPQED